jgi:hypothetical protein
MLNHPLIILPSGSLSTSPQEMFDDNIPPIFQRDDIRTEYHPRSTLPTRVDCFADFRRHTDTRSKLPENSTPWSPFGSRLDFEVAELTLQAHLTKEQTNTLIGLIRRSAFEKFSLTDYDGICKIWDAAASRHADVSLLKSTVCSLLIND